MALKLTMLSKAKANVQVKLTFVYKLDNKLVYQIEDTRNDDLNNVFYINQTKAFEVYDKKAAEIEEIK